MISVAKQSLGSRRTNSRLGKSYEELVRANVDAVKVTLEGSFSSNKVPLLSDAIVAALVDETHRSGRRIIAHGPITKHYIEMGIDEFVHLTAQPTDDRGPQGQSTRAWNTSPIVDASLE
jgi:hypothetical protein